MSDALFVARYAAASMAAAWVFAHVREVCALMAWAFGR